MCTEEVTTDAKIDRTKNQQATRNECVSLFFLGAKRACDALYQYFITTRRQCVLLKTSFPGELTVVNIHTFEGDSWC